jgi:gamma-glutamyltranspeptidase/glutathione hydrolase
MHKQQTHGIELEKNAKAMAVQQSSFLSASRREKEKHLSREKYFVQKDLLETLKKMIEAETNARKQKKSRKDAIMAAYNSFTKAISQKNLYVAARNRAD